MAGDGESWSIVPMVNCTHLLKMYALFQIFVCHLPACCSLSAQRQFPCWGWAGVALQREMPFGNAPDAPLTHPGGIEFHPFCAGVCMGRLPSLRTQTLSLGMSRAGRDGELGP